MPLPLIHENVCSKSLISKLESIAVGFKLYLPVEKIMLKKLSEIKPGNRVTIDSFADDEIFLKLMEMGCLPGETISVEKIAPLGDPISIKVSGYLLSLRLNEAEKILVIDL